MGLLSTKKDPTPKKIFIRLPFLGALFMQIRNKLKFFLHKHTDDRASVYIIDALSKIRENFRFKDKQPPLIKLGIVRVAIPSLFLSFVLFLMAGALEKFIILTSKICSYFMPCVLILSYISTILSKYYYKISDLKFCVVLPEVASY